MGMLEQTGCRVRNQTPGRWNRSAGQRKDKRPPRIGRGHRKEKVGVCGPLGGPAVPPSVTEFPGIAGPQEG